MVRHGHTSPQRSVRCYRLALFGAWLCLSPGLRRGGFCLSVFFDAQQVARPQFFETAHPALINLPDRHDVQRVDPLPALFTRVNQPGFAEHLHVLHNPEAAQVRKCLDDLSCRARALPQEVENRSPRVVGQSFPHFVEVAAGHFSSVARSRARSNPGRFRPGCASSRCRHLAGAPDQ